MWAWRAAPVVTVGIEVMKGLTVVPAGELTTLERAEVSIAVRD